MAHPTDRLVGRAVEVESLDRALTELWRRRPCALELAGEPGIGKTRLLAELEERADARGTLVLAGSASELERELPFWVFVDALDEYVHGLAPHRLAAMDSDARTELAHVLPSLGAAADLAAERYRTHRAMRQLLEALARDAPLAARARRRALGGSRVGRAARLAAPAPARGRADRARAAAAADPRSAPRPAGAGAARRPPDPDRARASERGGRAGAAGRRGER